MTTIDAIYPKVKEIIADVLAIDEDKIELKKSLVSELGAESIDFLDLIFRLEREFKVKIPRGQIEKEARGALSEEEFVKDGVLTAQGFQAVKSYLSEVPADRFKQPLKLNQLPTLFTVETFCKLVVEAKQKQA